MDPKEAEKIDYYIQQLLMTWEKEERMRTQEENLPPDALNIPTRSRLFQERKGSKSCSYGFPYLSFNGTEPGGISLDRANLYVWTDRCGVKRIIRADKLRRLLHDGCTNMHITDENNTQTAWIYLEESIVKKLVV